MVWGPSARILDVESEGMFKAVPSLAIDTLFQVERSSADMSLDSHASLREFQKLTRFGMARPPLSKGSSAISFLTTTFFWTLPCQIKAFRLFPLASDCRTKMTREKI